MKQPSVKLKLLSEDRKRTVSALLTQLLQLYNSELLVVRFSVLGHGKGLDNGPGLTVSLQATAQATATESCTLRAIKASATNRHVTMRRGDRESPAEKLEASRTCRPTNLLTGLGFGNGRTGSRHKGAKTAYARGCEVVDRPGSTRIDDFDRQQAFTVSVPGKLVPGPGRAHVFPFS
jgi:hypothetical protein